MSTPPTVWKQREAEPGAVAALSSALDLEEALARVMVGRGVTEAERADAFLHPSLKQLPDPDRLAGMSTAVDRVVAAVAAGETIGIFGDYDVDGVTSTTLLWDFLEGIGVTVVATLPDRLTEGYGLSRAGVDRLRDGGARLVVTVDCGVTAHEEVEYAKEAGIAVVVIDHHTVPVTLPTAVAVINPHREDCASGAEHLCAVGVTFNLCLAVRRRLREDGFFTAERPEPDLRRGLDLVALGTVADIVPLIDDNRVVVDFGLKVIARGERIGMRALLEVAGVDPGKVTAGTLGFQLGPRINAAGRLGSAMKAVELLRSTNPAAARELAETLDNENTSRRDLERRMFEDAVEMVNASPELLSARALVVGSESWHPGVVGIVASRLVERFGRPVVVVGEGGRGSGRSIPRFHLFDALRSAEHTLEGFGGHAHAAGVRVPEGGLERFREAMMAHAEEVLAVEDLGRVLVYDGEIDIEDVNLELCERLKRAAPYGKNNPEPTFRINGVVPHAIRELKGGHFKAIVRDRPKVEVIQFGQGERLPEFVGEIDLLATPEINEWRGSRTVQLRIKDFAARGAK